MILNLKQQVSNGSETSSTENTSSVSGTLVGGDSVLGCSVGLVSDVCGWGDSDVGRGSGGDGDSRCGGNVNVGDLLRGRRLGLNLSLGRGGESDLGGLRVDGGGGVDSLLLTGDGGDGGVNSSGDSGDTGQGTT